MKLLSTILLAIIFISCSTKNKQDGWDKENLRNLEIDDERVARAKIAIDLAQTRIEDEFQNLKKTKEVKFGGGDVWGTTHIFNNADSSVTKVVVEYDAGDYGQGQNEYLTINNRLVYQRDSIVDWLIVKSPSDSNKYKLRETICHFNPDSTGTRTSRAVYSMTFEFDEKKKNELKNKTADTVNLTKADYIKLFGELKEALERKVVEE